MKRAGAGAGDPDRKRVHTAPHRGAMPEGVGFCLTRCEDMPHTASQFAVGIQDALPAELVPGSALQYVVLGNYVYHPGWLRHVCPHLFTAPRGGVIIHGSTVDAGDMVPDPKYHIVKPALPPFGKHHSKFAILQYPGYLRVFITTANFIPFDWEKHTQGVWLQDFPLKSSSTEVASPFEKHLTAYLSSYGKYFGSGREFSDPSVMAEVQRLVPLYDFSGARAHLVGAVPGRHAGSQWGQLRVRALATRLPAGDRPVSVVGQYSSQSSTPDKYLSTLAISFSGGRAALPALKIVWPRVSDMLAAKGGVVNAGGHFPSVAAHVSALKPRHHVWDASVSGLTGFTPHMKTWLAYTTKPDGTLDDILLAYVGSANVSKAAWGELNLKRELYVKSYELGVVLKAGTHTRLEHAFQRPELPGSLHEVHGDLLRHPAAFICHQCNCVSETAKGLSAQVFRAFPHADVYSARAKTFSSVPGTVAVHGSPHTGRRGVVNLFGQIRPGAPSTRNSYDDAAAREGFFRSALRQLQRMILNARIDPGVDGIAFPDHVGCGLGGGDWPKYRQLLQHFAATVPCPVFVVKLGGGGGGAPPGTVLPVPFAVPPPRYGPGDEPWSASWLTAMLQ